MCKHIGLVRKSLKNGGQGTVVNASNAASLPKMLQEKLHMDTSGHARSGGSIGKLLISALQKKLLKRNANIQNGYNPAGNNMSGNSTPGNNVGCNTTLG